MEARKKLVAYSLKFNGDFNRILKAINDREPIEEMYCQMVDTLKCKTLTLADPEYPKHLKNAFKPPIVLYYYGDISLLMDYDKNVSVVGSRDCSDYGSKMTTEIAGGLAEKGYVIVSGLARGIDGIAHVSAIEAGGKTIAVLGSGIACCYPLENQRLYEEIKKNHLVISEYPGDLMPCQWFFPIRNRIIASLSKTLVVTEAGEFSGSMITATLALNSNTDVMCVPYQAGMRSQCNRLIANGAALVESAEDVIKEMEAY